MKRGLVILAIAILLSLPTVFAAVNVVLSSPSGAQTSPNLTFTCTGSVSNASEDGNLSANAELLLGVSSPVTSINKTNTTVAGTSYTATFTVENLANGAYYWNCRFFNSTSDNSVNATAASDGTFSVSYTPPSTNNAPSFSGTIPNQSFAEDGSLNNSFDLDSYFSDASSLAYSVTGNSSLKVAIAPDGQVSFSSTGNVSFNETIYFIASDGNLTNRSNNVIVNVYSVNDAPYLKYQIPAQNMSKNANHTLTLSDYFADADGSALNYSVTTLPSNVNVTLSGAVVTLVPFPNWTGNATIVFAANDSKNLTSSNTVNLIVTAGANTAPLISNFNPSSANVKMKSTESVTFSIVKSDADGDALTVQWYLNDQAISGATADSYQLSNPNNGSHTVKVIVSDLNSSVQKSWAVDVTEVTALNFSTPSKVETSSLFNADGSAKKYSVCGNGVIDPGEDCLTCIEDVRCGDDEVCINALCEKKKKGGRLFGIVGLVSLVIILLVFGLYKLNASRHPLDERPKDVVRKFGVSNLELKPASEIKDFYHKKSQPGKNSTSTPLRKEIAELRKQGLTDQDIIDKLKAKGWPQWQVETRLREK